MATLSGIVTHEQKNEQLSRETLRKLSTDPLIESVMNRVKASALVGFMICDYTIPDTYPHVTVEYLIRLLKPRLPDVTLSQTGLRSIQIDWT
jgi:hypothetical protein